MMPTRSSTDAKKPAAKARSTRPAAKTAALSPRGAPTTAELRRVARSIVTATSVNDSKRMLSLYHEGVESTEPGQPTTRGLAALKKKFADFEERYGESKWYARNLWVDGQTVIIEWEAQMQSRPYKGRSFREIAVHELRNGKIIRERFYYDTRQLD